MSLFCPLRFLNITFCRKHYLDTLLTKWLYVLGKELIDEMALEVDSVPILGFLQTAPQNSTLTTKAGRIITYGDSNCLESNTDGMGKQVLLILGRGTNFLL